MADKDVKRLVKNLSFEPKEIVADAIGYQDKANETGKVTRGFGSFRNNPQGEYVRIKGDPEFEEGVYHDPDFEYRGKFGTRLAADRGKVSLPEQWDFTHQLYAPRFNKLKETTPFPQGIFAPNINDYDKYLDAMSKFMPKASAMRLLVKALEKGDK